jgi:hypothetical protein
MQLVASTQSSGHWDDKSLLVDSGVLVRSMRSDVFQVHVALQRRIAHLANEPFTEPAPPVSSKKFMVMAGRATTGFVYILSKQPCVYCSICQRFKTRTSFNLKTGSADNTAGYFHCAMATGDKCSSTRTVEITYREHSDQRYGHCLSCRSPAKGNKVGVVVSFSFFSSPPL